MTTIKFGKYKGKEIREISQIDPKYICWIYHNSIKAGKTLNHDLIHELETELENVGFDYLYKDKKDDNEFFKTIAFGKYKGQTFENIVEKDAKYLWYIKDMNNKKGNNTNIKLKYTILYRLGKSGCIIGDIYNHKRGLVYCRACNTSHRIN